MPDISKDTERQYRMGLLLDVLRQMNDSVQEADLKPADKNYPATDQDETHPHRYRVGDHALAPEYFVGTPEETIKFAGSPMKGGLPTAAQGIFVYRIR